MVEHVIVRQGFIPRVSFNAKFKVIIPNLARYPRPHINGRDVAEEFIQAAKFLESSFDRVERKQVCRTSQWIP